MPEARLDVSGVLGDLARQRVKTRRVKFVVGIFLLVPAVLLTQTVFAAYRHAHGSTMLWLTEEFWCCGLGAALWVVWFFASIWTMGRPQPLAAYVYGHEMTHAIWVWLMGGKVSKIKHSSEGGYILTNTNNFWIALAPYFYPIYTLAVILVFSVVGVFYDVTSEDLRFLWGTLSNWMFLLIGLTWGFHFSFTCWMIPKGQSDLRSHGTFFSLVVIYLVNLLLITLFLIVAAQPITLGSFAQELLINLEDFSAGVVEMLEWVGRWLRLRLF
jgi:hypothetical protein